MEQRANDGNENPSDLERRLELIGELEEFRSHADGDNNYINTALKFLNNFSFRMPGGWYTSKDMRSYFSEEQPVFEDIKETLLACGLTRNECAKLESMEPKQHRENIWKYEKYRLVPLMLDAYFELRKRYSRQALIK